MPKIDAKDLLLTAARYLKAHPTVVTRVAINAAAWKITIPLDVLRYFVTRLSEGKDKAPKDVILEARPPALHGAASIKAMGTPLRAGASIRVDQVTLGLETLRFDIRLSDVQLKLEAPSDTPVAMLVASGALDLSAPGNLVKFLPKRPAIIVDAADDHIALDLMKHEKLSKNARLRRALELVSPVLEIRAIKTEGDNLVIALRPIPAGVGEVVARVRGDA